MNLKKSTYGLLMLMLGGAAVIAADSKSQTEAFIQEIIKDAKSDAQRSALLMEAGSLAEDNRELKTALFGRSVQYGLKSLRTAEDCDKLQSIVADLTSNAPDRRAYWLSQLAEIHLRRASITKSATDKKKHIRASVDTFARAGAVSAAGGDWKQASVSYNRARAVSTAARLPDSRKMSAFLMTSKYVYKVQESIAEHIKTLEKTPDDLDVRSDLIEKIVTVLDDPVEATKHINDDVDEMSRSFISMAAGGISKLSMESCLALGEWYYKKLAGSPIGIVKSRMLARAEACYQRALSLHDKADVTAATLKINISRIKSAREKLGHVDPLVCMYCSGTGKMNCTACAGSGLSKCRYCKGSGRRKCSTCKGRYRTRCSRCSGKGKVASGRTKRGGVYYKTYSTCSRCLGRGMTYGSYKRPGACPKCSSQKESLRGTSACTYCKGKGGYRACTSCRGAKTARCTHCSSGRRD